jgi:hypothetical protein
MSSTAAGARRRAFTIFSAVAIAFALAMLSAGAGATSKCEEEVLGTSTFTDPTGDGSGTNAPDISDIVVTSYNGGKTAFQIALPDLTGITSGVLVRNYLDSGKNAKTGDANGYEYMIQTVPNGTVAAAGPFAAKCEEYSPVTTLYAWSDSGWVKQETETLESWFSEGSLNVALNASELGKALTFNFAVYAASNVSYDKETGVPDISSASFDWAPDTGSYTYKPFEWSSYVDPVGDGSAEGAPAIEEFDAGMLIRIPIDSDSNATTGNANGYDYMIQAHRLPYDAESMVMGAKSVLHALCYQPTVALLKWNGESWAVVEGESLDWWYSKGLKLSLASSAIGSPAAFNFAVYAATGVTFDTSGWPDLTTAPAFDRAPGTGSFAFPLVAASAELVGDYTVTSRIVKSTGHLSVTKKSTKTWSFQKRCAKKKCATKLTVKGHGNYKLAKSGKAAYRARMAKKLSCSSASAPMTESFSMNVKNGGWVKGKWRVTKWEGTLKVTSAAKNASAFGGAGSYTAALTGTLKR